MAEEASINFYRIARCGYYKHGVNSPEFCSLADALHELTTWINAGGKTLGETCTYKIEDGEEGFHTYCFDVVKSDPTGECLVTTWNETPSSQGNFASVNSTSRVGEVDVSLTEIPPQHIPGYATYFWIVPDRKLLATIRFHHAVNGHQNLCRYMKEFLGKWTSHVVVDEADEAADHSIVGYRNDENSDPLHLNPMFKSFLLKKPGKIEFLKENRELIRTIYRKNVLSPQSQVDRSLLHRMFSKLGISDAPALNHDIKVKYEFSHTPDEAELDAIIADWENNHDSKWDDIGFKLKGDDEVHWLSHSLAKSTIELNVERENAEIINAESLLQAVQQQRRTLLREVVE